MEPSVPAEHETRLDSFRVPTPLEALRNAPALSEEGRQTTHRILERFDCEGRGIEILLQDLFDSSSAVVLSALSTLGELKVSKSLRFVARLLTQPDETIQCAALRCMGRIGNPSAVKTLFDFYNLSKSDKLRLAALEALGRLEPNCPEVRSRVEEYADSLLVKSETRAAAVSMLLDLWSDVDVNRLLSGAREEVVAAVLAKAAEQPRTIDSVLAHCLSIYPRLSAANRLRLQNLVRNSPVSGGERVILEGIKDVEPSVRQAAYKALGAWSGRGEAITSVLDHLSNSVEAMPHLEEDALAALLQLERSRAGKPFQTPELTIKVHETVVTLFQSLSRVDRKVGSDAHELGWLIDRSREYMEYYADEDFRQALLHFLKGGSYYTEEGLLSKLKESAVKVEVRHFEGYKALVEIIRNPKRSGIGLISRELAIAKLGKRNVLYRLIRNLRLTRLLEPAKKIDEAAALYRRIFEWGRDTRLYRLAEAALFALARADSAATSVFCRECIQPPLFSKICAIAALHMLGELDWSEMEPLIRRLLVACDDPYVLLNLVDALAGGKYPLAPETTGALLKLLCTSPNREVVQRLAELLGSRPELDVFDALAEGFEHFEPWRKSLGLQVLGRRVLLDKQVRNPGGLTELLYHVLRGDEEALRVEAALILWHMGVPIHPFHSRSGSNRE